MAMMAGSRGQATGAAHRGRGAQRALLAGRIAIASSLGLRQLVVETREQQPDWRVTSYRNILRAGFRPAYRRPFWSRAAGPAAVSGHPGADEHH